MNRRVVKIHKSGAEAEQESSAVRCFVVPTCLDETHIRNSGVGTFHRCLWVAEREKLLHWVESYNATRIVGCKRTDDANVFSILDGPLRRRRGTSTGYVPARTGTGTRTGTLCKPRQQAQGEARVFIS
jgi:hypothetical protein